MLCITCNTKPNLNPILAAPRKTAFCGWDSDARLCNLRLHHAAPLFLFLFIYFHPAVRLLRPDPSSYSLPKCLDTQLFTHTASGFSQRMKKNSRGWNRIELKERKENRTERETQRLTCEMKEANEVQSCGSMRIGAGQWALWQAASPMDHRPPVAHLSVSLSAPHLSIPQLSDGISTSLSPPLGRREREPSSMQRSEVQVNTAAGCLLLLLTLLRVQLWSVHLLELLLLLFIVGVM